MIPKLDKRLLREVERCIFFIQNVFKHKGFDKAIIGISGGLDSAVVATLCANALGKDNVYGIMLPYGKQKDIADSIEFVKWLDISNNTINISQMVDSFVNSSMNRARIGNIMSRCRMIMLYDISAECNGLVVGTSNKTELMTGYFTIHGDGACALEPIGHLYKTWVKEIAFALHIPNSIIEKAPTAGLWDGQTDEIELGITYDLLDNILYNYQKIINETNRLMSEITVIENISDEFNIDIKIVDKIISRIEKNKFKLQPPMILGK